MGVDLGCGAGHILKQLQNVGKVRKLIQLDSSSLFARVYVLYFGVRVGRLALL